MSDISNIEIPESVPVTEAKHKGKGKGKGKSPKYIKKVAPPTEVDLIEESVHSIITMGAEESRPAIKTLINQVHESYFTIGGILSLIQRNGWYTTFGFENFRDYVEADVSLYYHKALYLIEIYEKLVASDVPWSAVKSLPWTKIREIAPVVTLQNVDELVALAHKLTVVQLHDAIKNNREALEQPALPDAPEGKAKSPKITLETTNKVTTLSIKLHSDQKEIVFRAISRMKEDSGTEYDSVALEQICLAYLASENGGPQLESLMQSVGPERVLDLFEKCFPTVDLEITGGLDYND